MDLLPSPGGFLSGDAGNGAGVAPSLIPGGVLMPHESLESPSAAVWTPERLLWLAVLIDAFETLQNAPGSETQRWFCLSPDNDIIDHLADALGVTGDAFRRRMAAALARRGRRRMPQEARTAAG